MKDAARGRTTNPALERLQRRLAEKLRAVLADRDLVIAHNVMTMPFNPALTGALGEVSKPLIAWTHDFDFSAHIPRAARRPDMTYVAISRTRQHELARALGMSREEILYVPNGVDRFDLAGLGERTLELLQSTGLADADPLLLVPQRVTPRKRIELVIDAAHELVQDLPGLGVAITGPPDPHQPWVDGYADGLLERRRRLGLEGVVRFLFESRAAAGEHPVGSREVADLYRVSDVALMPSESEGFGLPILETALTRLPLVCTDIPVLREVGGESLHTFPADSGPAEVADAVRRALATPAVRRRREVLSTYGWLGVLERTEEAFQAAWAAPAGAVDLASGAAAL
jgi:glycosyltransferase involved in cell wall biosynthesis